MLSTATPPTWDALPTTSIVLPTTSKSASSGREGRFSFSDARPATSNALSTTPESASRASKRATTRSIRHPTARDRRPSAEIVLPTPSARRNRRGEALPMSWGVTRTSSRQPTRSGTAVTGWSVTRSMPAGKVRARCDGLVVVAAERRTDGALVTKTRGGTRGTDAGDAVGREMGARLHERLNVTARYATWRRGEVPPDASLQILVGRSVEVAPLFVDASPCLVPHRRGGVADALEVGHERVALAVNRA